MEILIQVSMFLYTCEKWPDTLKWKKSGHERSIRFAPGRVMDFVRVDRGIILLSLWAGMAVCASYPFSAFVFP
jgi:hypothetical protein